MWSSFNEFNKIYSIDLHQLNVLQCATLIQDPGEL